MIAADENFFREAWLSEREAHEKTKFERWHVRSDFQKQLNKDVLLNLMTTSYEVLTYKELVQAAFEITEMFMANYSTVDNVNRNTN